MKKKTVLIVALVLAAAAVGYVGYRLAIRGTDIVGVTTLPDRNTVIVNGKTGDEFESGTGFLTVGEGQKLHVEYDVKSGSFDVAFRADEDAAAAYEEMDVDNLPTAEEMTGEGSFGTAELTGKSSLDFDAEPGDYTVYITNHGMVGNVKVTAVK